MILVFAYYQGKLRKDIPLAIQNSKWPPKLLYANQIVFKLTTPLCKLSLCLLYRKICAASTGRLIERTRIAICATIILIIGVYTSALLVSIFQCTPIHKTWDQKTPGSCINPTSFRYSTAIFNLITSVTIITIPIPMLLKLKHQRPEIKQLIGLILLGLMHTSLTFARLVYMFYPDPLIKSEPQYGSVPTQTLAIAEMDANILFATLVVMRPAFQALYNGLSSRCINRDGVVKTVSIRDARNGFEVVHVGKHRRGLSGTYILEKTASDDGDGDSTLDLEESRSTFIISTKSGDETRALE
jgi:hypothetical protein